MNVPTVIIKLVVIEEQERLGWPLRQLVATPLQAGFWGLLSGWSAIADGPQVRQPTIVSLS